MRWRFHGRLEVLEGADVTDGQLARIARELGPLGSANAAMGQLVIIMTVEADSRVEAHNRGLETVYTAVEMFVPWNRFRWVEKWTEDRPEP